jgi:ATP adenylyltransferase/5',5'''-P-1,P-4-tetraphosphate phosphorylase II
VIGGKRKIVWVIWAFCENSSAQYLNIQILANAAGYAGGILSRNGANRTYLLKKDKFCKKNTRYI